MRRRTGFDGTSMKVLAVVLVVVAALSCTTPTTEKSTLIHGTIVGYDDKPLKKSGVYLFYTPQGLALEFAETDADGQFRLSTERTGLLFLRFAGPHHRLETAVVLVQEPSEIEFRIQLTTPDYPEDFGNLELIGVRPDGSFGWQQPFTKETDGTYTVEIETEIENPSFQILGDQQATNWLLPNSESYISNGRYRRPINALINIQSGRTRLVFDPSSLPRSDRLEQIEFVDSPARQEFDSVMARTVKRENLRREKIYQAGLKGLLKDNWVFDHLAASTSQVERLEERIRNASGPIRQALLMDYLYLTETAQKANPDLIAAALDELGPSSPFWWWPHSNTMAGVLGSAVGKTADPGKYEGYLLEMIDHSPIPDMKARTYASVYGLLTNRGWQTDWGIPLGTLDWLRVDPDEIAKRAIAEFPDHPRTKRRILPFHNPDRNIQIGKPVPQFSVPIIGADGKKVTNETIQARIYLVDFWATWCGPCIMQMPGLHRLYEEYHPDGFEILSYSFDSSTEIVNQFRKEKWPMPWLNAIEPEQGFEARIAKDFEVSFVPTTVLVTQEGAIVQVNPTEEELEDFLEEQLGE